MNTREAVLVSVKIPTVDCAAEEYLSPFIESTLLRAGYTTMVELGRRDCAEPFSLVLFFAENERTRFSVAETMTVNNELCRKLRYFENNTNEGNFMEHTFTVHKGYISLAVYNTLPLHIVRELGLGNSDLRSLHAVRFEFPQDEELQASFKAPSLTFQIENRLFRFERGHLIPSLQV